MHAWASVGTKRGHKAGVVSEICLWVVVQLFFCRKSFNIWTRLKIKMVSILLIFVSKFKADIDSTEIKEFVM